ncbi:MAG: hypothetical protein MHM6MM_004576 [Cercozoa sp. M6MM]
MLSAALDELELERLRHEETAAKSVQSESPKPTGDDELPDLGPASNPLALATVSMQGMQFDPFFSSALMPFSPFSLNPQTMDMIMGCSSSATDNPVACAEQLLQKTDSLLGFAQAVTNELPEEIDVDAAVDQLKKQSGTQVPVVDADDECSSSRSYTDGSADEELREQLANERLFFTTTMVCAWQY